MKMEMFYYGIVLNYFFPDENGGVKFLRRLVLEPEDIQQVVCSITTFQVHSLAVVAAVVMNLPVAAPAFLPTSAASSESVIRTITKIHYNTQCNTSNVSYS